MGDAILGALYSSHSEEFRERLSNDVERIIFVDGGLATKRDGKWEVELEGEAGEAATFVADQQGK